MDIHEATTAYERWMRRCTAVIERQLRDKHQQIRKDLFAFLRGTFYRWLQICPVLCADEHRAPRVLAVGDLHVDSFGTWRDVEGRLCWGVDDFDEAGPLPYSNDLIRLAASVRIVIADGHLGIKFKDACDAIIEGYQRTLKNGGDPIVLAEREMALERLGVDAFKPPQDFWHKLTARPAARHRLAPDARRALARTLPPHCHYKVVSREAGLGSLGHLRFVGIAEWKGGWIGREVKAIAPPASVWLSGSTQKAHPYYARAIEHAVRSRDPFQAIDGRWLIRRLSPDSNPIEIATLPKKRDEETLLQAMGTEAANVHLGTRTQVTRLLADLRRRKSKWLRVAAKAMADALHRDWKTFRAQRSS